MGGSQEVDMIRRILKGLITIYKWVFSPMLGTRCRFYPSCSQYALSCLDCYPTRFAIKKIVTRLGRCHPWHPGGVDLP